MAKEIRITFKETELDLYDYVKGKSSPSAFLKDLATLEQKKEQLYLNVNMMPLTDTPAITYSPTDETEQKGIEELDISDLDF